MQLAVIIKCATYNKLHSILMYILIPVHINTSYYYKFYTCTVASLIVVSIILSIMSNFLSIAQKHNRQNFEHNRPGPIFKSLTTRYFLSFHSRVAVQLGMSLFCFLFHLFFFPAILFFLPIMLNILLQVVIFCSKFSYIAKHIYT